MPDPAHSARALHTRAKSLLNGGDLLAAEEVLREAETAASDVDERGLIDGTLAFIEAERGRTDDAAQRCRRRLEDDLSEDVRAQLTGQLGYVRWLTGDVTGAIALFDEALATLTGTFRDRLLNNRGVALLTIGELGAAADDFRAGTQGSDEVEVAKCAHNLGYVELLRGDLVSALRRMDAARPVLMRLGPASRATNDIDRAEGLAAAGLTDEAAGLLRRARSELEGADLWRYQADIEVQLADLLPPEHGEALAEAAASRCADHGNHAGAAQAHAVALHLAAQTSRPPSPEQLEETATRLAAAGRAEAARQARVRASGLRGRVPESVERGAPLTTHLLVGEVASDVALASGDTHLALTRSRAAVRELEEWQRRIGSLELQTSTLVRGKRVIGLGQRAALASGDPSLLLEWSERAREVAARGVPSRPPEELGDLLATLRHLGPEGDPQQRADMVEQIRHGRWHAGGSITPEATLTVDRLQSALAEARYVSILCIQQDVIALVVDPDRVHVLRLGPWQHLEARLTGLAADLAMAAQTAAPLVRRSLADRLAAIDAILAPALSGASQVVLTVPDELAQVPWGQLTSLRGVAVALPLSATAWVRAAEDTSHAPASIAVVLGPGTDTGKVEADAVLGAWGNAATARVHHDATCDEVRALAGEVDVLHVSAHGRDRDGHRLFAATELHDGPWFGHDVELLPRVPDTVVLSACGVGGGSLGMARAWLHAGARHVIAAPADISETAAAERFPRLHALLAAGVAPQRAVAEAFGPDALDCAVQCYGPSPATGVSG